eukprot:113648-Chlamydomonas_euryale.AAC.8
MPHVPFHAAHVSTRDASRCSCTHLVARPVLQRYVVGVAHARLVRVVLRAAPHGGVQKPCTGVFGQAGGTKACMGACRSHTWVLQGKG